MFTIGKLAAQTAVTVETIRYYEQEGLLRAPLRTTAGYRQYDQHSVQRLQFILRAKQLGFTLAEIRELLSISASTQHKPQAKQITERKLAVIEQKISDLQRMQTALAELNEACDGEQDGRPCPIVAALSP